MDNALLAEYIYYFFITGIIFYLFVLLLTIFGSIIFKLVSKIFIKSDKKIPIIERFFLSFGIGITVYISYSFFPLTFSLFNFYFNYLPLVIIDLAYVIYYLITFDFKRKEGSSSSPLKIIIHDFGIIIKEKLRKNHPIIILLIILFFFQFYIIWPNMTSHKSLLFVDTWGYLWNICELLDTGSLRPSSHFFYPPGHFFFIGGALLITPQDYRIIFYYIKFGGFHLITLYIILIFYITLKCFKKKYIAFCCSLLFLSFYLFLFRAIAFLTGTTAGFFFGVSIFVFIQEKKYLILMGFFFPLIYFFNPVTSFYQYFLISIFLFVYLFIFDRKNLLENIKIVLIILIFSIILALPDYFYLVSNGYHLQVLLEWYFHLVFRTPAPTQIPSSANGEPSGQHTNVSRGLFSIFLTDPTRIFTSVTLKSQLLIFILAGLGFRLKTKKRDLYQEKIHYLGKISLIMILISYVLLIISSNGYFFFMTFHDRVFETYCSLIIILTGFGLAYLDKLIKNKPLLNKIKENLISIRGIGQIFEKLSEKIEDVKKKNDTLRRLLTLENLKLFLILSSILISSFNQQDVIRDTIEYNYSDDCVDAFLFLRENIPRNSKILVPDIRIHKFLRHDMKLYISPFNKNSTFIEFENYIKENNIEYVMLDESEYNSDVINNLEDFEDDYECLFKNNYSIYEVKYNT